MSVAEAGDRRIAVVVMGHECYRLHQYAQQQHQFRNSFVPQIPHNVAKIPLFSESDKIVSVFRLSGAVSLICRREAANRRGFPRAASGRPSEGGGRFGLCCRARVESVAGVAEESAGDGPLRRDALAVCSFRSAGMEWGFPPGCEWVSAARGRGVSRRVACSN